MRHNPTTGTDWDAAERVIVEQVKCVRHYKSDMLVYLTANNLLYALPCCNFPNETLINQSTFPTTSFHQFAGYSALKMATINDDKILYERFQSFPTKL